MTKNNKKILQTITLNENEEKFIKIIKQIELFVVNLSKRAKIYYFLWFLIASIIFLANIVLLGLASFTLGIILNDSNVSNSLELALSALVVFFTIVLFILTSTLTIYRANSRYQKFQKTYQELEYLLIKAKKDTVNYDKKKLIQLLLNINNNYLKKKKKLKVKKALQSILINEKVEEGAND